ncbi:putative disease resistance RPP13-like protein 1 [Nicotiana tabacum]|uniref:Disease resistance RPP13-like protein 1 n=4 Tax=Nicotiana TaxID=4085 RepID=A0AC58TUR1_TOBAC|nr:PREDICTED: putative disease resistance RPP13-like protein 1 [Nicotiana sylvestris]XP_016436017.1 PREDICTED: putative disease resistance RPP13-like protein 1 [Nicotiana tabacum]
MEIGLAVGGAFLSSALNVLFDRLAPQGELLKMFQRDKHDVRLLKKLRITLLGLQAVLCDAENKKASNQYVSQWLIELQDAVDSAENLMEEINYEVLRVKVEGQYQNLGETSNQQVSDLNLCLSDEFFLNIKEKLEDAIETLEELEKQIGRLDLKAYLDSSKQETRKPSTSVVDESDIFGRQNEIMELVDRLLSVDANGKNLTVIPIVGMAGVGKTTLAKAVYNDENKVKDHFNLKAWICVSEPYDAFRITKGLLQEIGSFDSMIDNNLNQLQIKLKENLKGKKFLIVLDDIWNENYNEWDDLRNLFVQGEKGSKIVVTTRKESIALMMGSGPIRVGTLSGEVSWDLFERHALENRDPKGLSKLRHVGIQIANKCNGLPLALKTLAGLLRSKSDVEEWRHILRSETWELPNCPNGILPALMLSYNDLPAYLKRCFSYCAIFPKDYSFCKEQVIHLWIANGLIQRFHKDENIEDSSIQCFLELKSRSLFERVPNSTQRSNIEKYQMHDLVNDLAQIASAKLCIRLEDNEPSHTLERSRHLSYSMDHGDLEKLKPLYKLEQLRTLLPLSIQPHSSIKLSERVLHNILPTLKSLRALSLSRYAIKELPSVLFIKLKLLRFLDLSRTMIKMLPDSVCLLYNLETLLLSSCDYLIELPLQLENLISLRHLDISGSSLLKLSLHPSKLKSLHVLRGARFLLGGYSGSIIGELGELHNLYGSVSVLALQNVVDRKEAQKANMRKKEYIEELSLEWSESIADNSQIERDILDDLQPDTNIKELQITGYRGTKFPNWLAYPSFLKLVKLSLIKCKDCDSLPALGQISSLKFLTIKGMHRVLEVTEEFYGTSFFNKPFNSLEKLEFSEMLEWKQWHLLGNGEFPILRDLSIENCPKLMGKLPENLSSLIELNISKCPQLILETPVQLPYLKMFRVVGSPKLGVLFNRAELFTSQLQGLKQIAELYIIDCHALTSLPISSLPDTLKRIWMYRCGKLKLESPVSEMITSGHNMFLESFRLHRCHSIDDILPELVPRAHSLSVDGCPRLTRLLIPTATEVLGIYKCENLEILSVARGTQMTSLHTLVIRDCQKLKSMPERMQELLPFLKKLELHNCPEIKSFPEEGLPFSLGVLVIDDCKKLVHGRKQWHLQRLPYLTELTIFHDGSDEEILADENWELPSSIRILMIYNLKTLSSQVLKNLTSLIHLLIGSLPQVWSLLEEGLPSSLCYLSLYDHPELHSLPTEGLRSLTSLQCLRIDKCPNLHSLPELALPSSLIELRIDRCPNLKPLPLKGMPPSIFELSISECPLRKPRLEFEKGGYFAHISEIYIDGECL